jgi:nucleoside-diphosphate-sugar epimerase
VSRRVALTGASGFVGSHLLEQLVARGDRVRCLARPGQALERPEAEVVPGRLADGDALRRLVEGADVVFHVAGAIAARDEHAFDVANRDGTAAVVAACAVAGVGRLVHVSSLAVTGPTTRGVPLDETSPPRPVTPYGRSKARGEQVVREGTVPFTIVRPPVVYGPRDTQLRRLFRAARTGLVPLLGDGRQQLSLVHGTDLAHALLAAAEAPAGAVYHAAHPEVVDQRRLAELAGMALGRRVRVVPVPVPIVRAALHASGLAARLTGRATLVSPDKGPEFFAPAWLCTSAALERDTGWRARIGHEDGMRQTAQWYRSAGWR